MLVEPNTFPKITIIILNWNGKEDTLECLESVRNIDYPNYDIIVVDNGSTDGSLAEIRKQDSEVNILETGKNLGFAEGNNVGLRFALAKGAEFVFLLNNDTIVDPSILRAFLEAVHLYPDTGIFGAKIYFYSDPDKIWYAGAKWIHEDYSFIHCGYGKKDADNFEEIIETDYATGCALFAKVKVFDKVGFLDSKFFLTYEESDFCFRARRTGYKCLFVPKAKVWHKISASFGGQKSPLFSYFMARNRLLWAKRNLSFKQRFDMYKKTYKDLLPRLNLHGSEAHSLPKKLYWALLQYRREFLERYNDPFYKARLWGVRDYFLGRFGDCPKTVRELGKISQA
jgi:GT2 family glycosyltransferase